MREARRYPLFSRVEPVRKGWSDDRKYRAVTKRGEDLLIRVSDRDRYEEKKQEFALTRRIAATGIPMSQPVDFGVHGNAVYQILTWCGGREAKEVLPLLPEAEQYRYGVRAGEILRRMQEIKFRAPSDAWAECYAARITSYLAAYRACGETMYGEERILPFLRDHALCMRNRPTALLHGDFQTDNMVISPDGELAVIDFQGSGFLDPFLAMGGVMVSAETSPAFSNGQLRGFFGGRVPDDFWECNAFYLAAECVNAFAVAVRLGGAEVAYSNRMMRQVLEWYDGLNTLIPSWVTP